MFSWTEKEKRVNFTTPYWPSRMGPAPSGVNIMTTSTTSAHNTMWGPRILLILVDSGFYFISPIWLQQSSTLNQQAWHDAHETHVSYWKPPNRGGRDGGRGRDGERTRREGQPIQCRPIQCRPGQTRRPSWSSGPSCAGSGCKSAWSCWRSKPALMRGEGAITAQRMENILIYV